MPSETGFFAFRVADKTFHDAYTGKTPLYQTISLLYENSQSGKLCETTYVLTRWAKIEDFVLVSSRIT